MPGWLIGAIAGVCAVLVFRLTQKNKDGGKKPDSERKEPVKIDYKTKK